MDIFYIINPMAGSGRALEAWRSIEGKIGNATESNVKFTQYKGHATLIAKEAADAGYDIIVACGGDGTINEVVNGIAGSGATLAIIPLGTGSDFGKTIGIRNIVDAMSALKNGKTVSADVGEITFMEKQERRYFINILEIGFGAEVMSYVNSHRKNPRYSFLMGIISSLFRLSSFHMEFISEGGRFEYDTIEVIVSNGRYFGGGMLASPRSDISDGRLDVHILRPVSRMGTLTKLRSLIDGSYIEKGYSNEHSIKSSLFNAKGVLVEADGEIVGNAPIGVKLGGFKINVIVNY